MKPRIPRISAQASPARPTPDHGRRCARRPHGFTIIELLLVITLVVVLIALLLPVLARARDSARAMRSQANLHQLSVWAFARAAAANGYLPNNYQDPAFGYLKKWHLVAAEDLNLDFADSDTILRDPQLGNRLQRETPWGVLTDTGYDYGQNAYMGGWSTAWTPAAPPMIEDLDSETYIFSSSGKRPNPGLGGAFANFSYVETDGTAPLFNKTMMPWPWKYDGVVETANLRAATFFTYGDGHVEEISRSDFAEMPHEKRNAHNRRKAKGKPDKGTRH